MVHRTGRVHSPTAKKTPTLEWSEAAKIDWGTVILVGVGLTVGAMMKATGLAETIGAAVADVTGVNSVLLLRMIKTGVVADLVTIPLILLTVIGIGSAIGLSLP